MEIRTKYMIYIDVERCTGCCSCEIACAIEHSATKTLYGAVMEKPRPKPRIQVFKVGELNVPVRCLHCTNAPCVQVCPVNAMRYTEEGFVVVDDVKCIGCSLCSLACPIGHPMVDPETGKAIKCDFCQDRLRRGLLPACVEACPVDALVFGGIEEVMEAVKRRGAEMFARARLSSQEILSKHPMFHV